MNIKKAIENDVNIVGLSKIKVAEKYDTNVKQIDRVLDSMDGSYVVSKIVLPKAMTAGINKQEEAI